MGHRAPLVHLEILETLVLQESQVLLDQRVTQVRQAVLETQVLWGQEGQLGRLEQLVQQEMLEAKELQDFRGLRGYKDQWGRLGPKETLEAQVILVPRDQKDLRVPVEVRAHLDRLEIQVHRETLASQACLV